jgi:histidine triad (HIT) family protein
MWKLKPKLTCCLFALAKTRVGSLILIVPKKGIRRLTDITEKDSALLVDIFQTVTSIVDELGIEQQGYRLITNGGEYQEVQQLHFHLVSGSND